MALEELVYVWCAEENGGSVIVEGSLRAQYGCDNEATEVHLSTGTVLPCLPGKGPDDPWSVVTDQISVAYMNIPHGMEVKDAPRRHANDVAAHLEKFPPRSNVVVVYEKPEWVNFWDYDIDPATALARYIQDPDSAIDLSGLPVTILELIYRYFARHPSGLVDELLTTNQMEDIIANVIASSNLVDLWHDSRELTLKEREAFNVLFPDYVEKVGQKSVVEALRLSVEPETGESKAS